MDKRNKKKKRKKSQNSPKNQSESPEQKRQPVIMFSSQQNGTNNGSQPSVVQPNAFFQIFSQPGTGMPFGQPYYSSSPPPSLGSPGQGQAPSPDILSKIFNRLDTMDKKLGQLDSIQVTVNKITDQVNTMNTNINCLETKMESIEDSRKFDSKSLDLLQAKQKQIDDIMQKMQKLEADQKEKLIDLQCREMRDNLIFYNFKEERGETDKDCIEKLYRLMENELEIESARTIQFHRVHRMGRFNRNKTRPIVAKFAFYPDRERVRGAAKKLEGTSYSIGQQFPKEVQDRRRVLVPMMKKAKNEGKEAYISVDKLYIDETQYVVKSDPVDSAAGAAVTVVPAKTTGSTVGAAIGTGATGGAAPWQTAGPSVRTATIDDGSA